MSEADHRIVGSQFLLLYDANLPPVSTQAVARITGIAPGTINVWINRELLPGVKSGTPGRARSFDASLVVHLSVMSALVRLGHSAHFASIAAIEAFQKGPHPREQGVHLIIEAAPRNEFGRLLPPDFRQVHVIRQSSEINLEAAIKAKCSERAEGFAVVDLSAIWNRVKRAIEDAAAEQ